MGPQNILHFYRGYSRNDEAPPLGKCVQHFLDVAGTFHQIFLVIDALDKYAESQRKEFIRSITKILESLSYVKIFVTSTRECDTEHEFDKQEAQVVEIEAKAVLNDIRVFVHDSVKKLVEEGDLRLGAPIRPELESKVIYTLTSRAEGM